MNKDELKSNIIKTLQDYIDQKIDLNFFIVKNHTVLFNFSMMFSLHLYTHNHVFLIYCLYKPTYNTNEWFFIPKEISPKAIYMNIEDKLKINMLDYP